MSASQAISASKRKAQRDALFLSSTLRVEGVSKPGTVRVRNLSDGGMMVDGNVGFEIGRRVEAELRGIGTVQGHVAWTESGRAGIAFDEPIDPKLTRHGVALPEQHRLGVIKAPKIVERRPGLRIRD